MRILLTGSSGRVGRNLLLDGLAARHQVTAFDWAPPQTRLGNVRYVAGSVLDRKDLSDAMQGAEAVIHLAAIPYDIPPLHQVFHINVQGTYHALELAVEHGVRHFLHASSLMAYGFGRNAEAQYLPIDEDHPAASHDTYGVGKLLTEFLCRAFTDKFGLRTLCFRLTHFTAFLRHYGDRFPYDDDSGIQGLHEYIESRDLVELLEAALASGQVLHDVFLASGPDSGHVPAHSGGHPEVSSRGGTALRPSGTHIPFHLHGEEPPAVGLYPQPQLEGIRSDRGGTGQPPAIVPSEPGKHHELAQREARSPSGEFPAPAALKTAPGSNTMRGLTVPSAAPLSHSDAVPDPTTRP